MSINDFKKKWEPDDVLKWLTKYLGEKGQRLTETQRKTLEGIFAHHGRGGAVIMIIIT